MAIVMHTNVTNYTKRNFVWQFFLHFSVLKLSYIIFISFENISIYSSEKYQPLKWIISIQQLNDLWKYSTEIKGPIALTSTH